MKTKLFYAILAFTFLTFFNGHSQPGNKSCVPTDEIYYNKVRGEWLGKCIGGALGMPIEGWSKEQISRYFGDIKGYTGYFDERVMRSSSVLKEVDYPADGKWQSVKINLHVPDYDTTVTHAVPLIWIIGDVGNRNECELRKLEIKGVNNVPDFIPKIWKNWSLVTVSENGIAHFNAPGWVKLDAIATSNICLPSGKDVEITLEARNISGRSPNKIGISLDYISNKSQVGFLPDDDTSFQLVFFSCIEKNGPDIGCQAIGKSWLELCPKRYLDLGMLAEGIAYIKLVDGILPPETGKHRLSTAIGGQMKAEICGLICPGRPDLAAEYGRRDGVVAHAGDGVYGEQYVAAMIAKAFCENNVENIMLDALKQIPKDSKYARSVRKTIELYKKYPNSENAFKEYLSTKDTSETFHNYWDAGIVNLTLLYGKGDFEKSLLLAASYGHDTDCNCATVGALLGCISGADAIPKKWADPIGDKFASDTKGFENCKISELAQRICKKGREVIKFHRNGMRFTSDL